MIDLAPYKFHPSSVGSIMTDAKSIDPELLTPELAVIAKKKVKTDEDKELLQPLHDQTLSSGAKTYLESIAGEYVYDYHAVVSTKYMDKGLLVEDESIELYNSVFFTNHKKNTERRTDDILTGECDIDTGKKIIDIKSSWSLETFPKLSKHGIDTLYEWQLRAYMRLWDRDEAEDAYCLVDTPEELIKWEQEDIHYVSHINPVLRVTIVPFKRCPILEKKLETKCRAAQSYLLKVAEQIINEHK